MAPILPHSPEKRCLAWPQPVTQHCVPTFRSKVGPGRQTGCTYLLKMMGVGRRRRAMSPTMKVRPQYLGCIMMSFTGTEKILLGLEGCSWEVPSTTEYSLLLQETQSPTGTH